MTDLSQDSLFDLQGIDYVTYFIAQISNQIATIWAISFCQTAQ
jgi:hypothetical protein